MKPAEANRFKKLYQRHLRLLKLQGKSQKTIDAYSRAVRRIGDHFDCCPDQLTPEQLETYFVGLVETHSWSTVKVDRNGLQFYWRYVLKRDWQWVNIIKPPKIHTIPDILTLVEIEQLIGATRKLRYRTLKGEDFLHLIMQHVLPKGLRRVRDYGFVHGNAKKLLFLVQLILHVVIKSIELRPRPVFKCPCCKSPMVIIRFCRIAWKSG